MPDKFLNGIGGTVVATGPGGSPLTCKVNKWSGKKTVKEHERTHAGSAGWDVFIPGSGHMEGTVEAYLEYATMPDLANSAPLDPLQHIKSGSSDPDKYYTALTLNIGNSARYYSIATALINDLEVTSSTEEGCTFSFAFKSSGTVSGPLG